MPAHRRRIGTLALAVFGWLHISLAGSFDISSGAWSDPSNWTPVGVPNGSSATASIANGDVAMLDIAATVGGLTIGATSQLNLSGHTLSLDSSSVGTFSSSGLIAMAGGAISGTNGNEQLSAEGTIQGTGSIDNLTLSPPAGSTLTLDESQGGTLTVTASAAINAVNGNVLLLGSSGDVSLNNQGTVTIGDGNSFTFKADTAGGPFVINNDGAFNLNGGKLVFDNNGVSSSQFLTGSFSGTGTLNLAPGVINGASITSAPGENTFLTNAAGHTIQGAGTIDNSVSFSNAGTVVANSGGVLTIANSADYNPLTQTLGGANGIFAATDGSQLQIGNIPADSGIVNNYAAIVLDGTGQIVNGNNQDAISNILTNNFGTLQLQNSANLTLGNFTNSGNLNILGSLSALNVTGTFGNEQGGVLTGGTYKIGGTLNYAGNDITTIAANANLTLIGSGAIVNAAGFNPDALSATLVTNNGTLTVGSGAALFLLGPSLTNSGTLNLTGDQNGSASLFVSGNLINSGSLTVTGLDSNLNLFGSTALTNSGTVLVGTGADIFAYGPVTNSGTVTVEGTDPSDPLPGALIISPGSDYEQSGATALTQVDGVLAADEVDVDGGTLTGSGLVEGLLADNYDGTVAAGDAGGAVLSACAFNEAAGGNLLFTIGATGASQLDVGPATFDGLSGLCQAADTGDATLDGNIEFDFTNGFRPQVGQTFDLILAGSLTDDLASFSFENLGGWTPEFAVASNELMVTFVSPEPVPLGMMTAGLLLIGLIRLKKGQ